MSIKYIGNTDVRETWESGALVNGDQKEKTFVKVGRKSDLLVDMPVKGDVYAPGWVVESATLTPSHGGMARLIVSCYRKTRSSSGTGGGDEEGDNPTVIIEVSMAQIEKPLMAKDEWSGYGPIIEMWQSSPADVRAQKQYVDGDNKYDLPGGAADVADLMMRGVQSYICFAPVVQVQTTTSEKPTDVGKDSGKICDPPNDALEMLAGTWKWLKTGDLATRNANGSYTRSEEWTGADSWEELLYEKA